MAAFTRRRFHAKTERFVFILAVRLHKYDENARETETYETEDLSGDFKNGAWKNAGVDSKNEYLREYGGHC